MWYNLFDATTMQYYTRLSTNTAIRIGDIITCKGIVTDPNENKYYKFKIIDMSRIFLLNNSYNFDNECTIDCMVQLLEIIEKNKN